MPKLAAIVDEILKTSAYKIKKLKIRKQLNNLKAQDQGLKGL